MPQVTSAKPSLPLTQKIPPQVFALLAMISVQTGASIGERLSSSISPLGTTFLRLGFAALLLLLIWRPSVRELTRRNCMTILLFGVTVAAMNGLFYLAIVRIPLGIAVTLEFVGPLGVALLQSRRLKDLVWAACAAVGIILLAPIGATHIDLVGAILALLAGIFWGFYIIFNVQIGQAFSGGTGLSLSILVAALIIAPLGLSTAGPAIVDPHALLLGLVVSILSTVIPFSLELEALRRLPSRVFGILMSAEPAVATIIGFLILGQTIGIRSMVAIVFVMTASIGASLEGKTQH